jgi:hypothetical protein
MEGTKYSTIESLRGEYVYSELIHILTSTAIALRILFDQHPERFTNISQRPCGELFEDWPKSHHVDLTLREACKKIIHAMKIHYDEVDPDPGYNPDQIGVYLRLSLPAIPLESGLSVITPKNGERAGRLMSPHDP